ncbi:MAG TPA: cbb3-type cytochrome c oxidase N-terminal domain-containing protein [Opitutales bacterium]|nr:cbb3-type cytochrome c oxidase N-terminal domain-containing protein [Opitutales bacterium]
MNPPGQSTRNDVVLREHSFDGIQEFDQRLPNWWLYTLFGAIAFAVFAWLFFTAANGTTADTRRLAGQLDALDAQRFAAIKNLDDQTLWAMSRNPTVVAQGEKVFESICYTCHGANLQGGIGFRLSDNLWVHGTKPTEIFGVVTRGVPGTGMQSWNSQLGPQKITQVVAFVLSKQDPDNMVLIPRDQEPTLQHKPAAP